jgi:hypothetical protein
MDDTEQSTRRVGGSLTTQAYLLFGIATVLGLAHHLDHVIRGNHVGWPITAAVNAFTFSLAIYPLVALGVVLSVTGLAGARYWTGVMALGTAMLVGAHLSPWAIEPPADVIVPYADPLVGYAAFAVLLALIAAAALGMGYSLLLWRRADGVTDGGA